jgi:PhzF family phenazine biosynthesis protein
MRIPIYQVDAFASRVFTGNPAAVCPLDSWLPDAVMQSIAAENNLSETAFYVAEGEGFALRWFTPVCEVDLCGHATLAAAAVVFRREPTRHEVTFSSHSGPLRVHRADDLLALDFPSSQPELCEPPNALLDALPVQPLEVRRDKRFYVVELETEDQVRDLVPDLGRFQTLDRAGVIVTARGTEADFVSRFFAPRLGVPEDPVTGSAHCLLIPYWAAKLDKTSLYARQISWRGGDLYCELLGSRVLIAGHVVPYMDGTIDVPAG